MPLSDDFHQLKLAFTDPIQHHYELVRPIVFGEDTVTERSRQVGLDPRLVGEKAQRFIQHGMFGLADQRAGHAGRKPSAIPEPIAGYILYVKQLYPPLHYREIVRILERKFGFHTNHHTIQRFLRQHPLPAQLPLPWKTFHQFADAYQARWQVVRLFYEGWHQQSIAGCLQLSRQHVGEIIAAFQRDGFAGLEDQRSRPPTHPANQLALPLLKEVLDVQREYPRAGRFRVRGLLEQRTGQPPPSAATIGRAMAINRTHHGAPPPWVTNVPAAPPEAPPKQRRYPPQYRHQYWFVDIRYLVQLDGQWIYSLCLLEGYSRKILAGMASAYQDTVAVLQLLCAAVAAYGCPAGIVSDNGSVFTSHDYQAVLTALEITPCYIEKGKPWQNLIEAQFKIQLRLADAKFEQAGTLERIQEEHAAFVQTFNETAHWAHRKRRDGLRTPVAVLQWVHGREVALAEVERIFKTAQFTRTVNRHGYVSIQRFYIYAERGLARKRVAVWIYEGTVRIEYEQALLARYRGQYDAHHKHLQAVGEPHLYRTTYAAPQLEFWELDEEQWRKVREVPPRSRRGRLARASVEQLPLRGLALLLLVSPGLLQLYAENWIPNLPSLM
jgi:transposase InsO family protein